MGKALFMLIICFFLTTSCAMMQPHKVQVTKAEVGNHSYEGMVDPKVVIETWEEIKAVQVAQLWWEVFYLNPDKDSKILIVCTLRYINGYCGAYSYIYNNELYCFIRNQENCFKLYDWAGKEEQRERLKQRILNVLDGATI